MKYIKIILLVGLVAMTGCEKRGLETIEDLNKETVNDLFEGGEVIPRPDPFYEETDKGFGEQTASNGHKFLCNGKRVKETVVIDNLTLNAFDDRAATNTASLYPGSIIKIKDYMEQNDLSGIGGIQRAPVQVSSDLGDIRLVEDPSQRGNVDKVIKEMEKEAGTFAANVKSEVKEAYSLEQSMVHVGLDFNYLSNSVKSRFDFESNIERHSFVIKFYQIYHTASIGNPETPSSLFHGDVDPYKLNEVISTNGPLGLITEVAYGRMLVGIFTYEGYEFNSSSEVEGKFRKGFAQIDGEVDVDIRNFFSNSTFKVAILGGDAQEAGKVSGSGLGMESIQSVFNWMKEGGKDPSLGVPIQYKIRQLSDPNYPLLAISGAVEYDVPDCSKLPNHLVIEKIEVTNFPPTDDENSVWDENATDSDRKNPDVFLTVQRIVDGEWKFISTFIDEEWTDLTSSQLPKTLDVAIPVPEEFFRTSHVIQMYDNDEYILDALEDLSTDYEFMGEVRFNFGSYLKTLSNPENDRAYPRKLEIGNGTLSMILHLDWTTK